VGTQARHLPGPIAELHEEVAGLSSRPRTCRMGGHAQDDRPLPTRYPRHSNSPWDAPVAPPRVLPRYLHYPAPAPRLGPAGVPARSDRSISSAQGAGARQAECPVPRSGAAALVAAAAWPERRARHGQPSPASDARPDAAARRSRAGEPRSPRPWRRRLRAKSASQPSTRTMNR